MGNLKKQWIAVSQFCEKFAKYLLWMFIGMYRTVGTTHLGGSCRFEPSCSAYALEAIEKHNFFSAIWLILVRLCKCRPGGPSGYDPVPPCCGDIHANKKQ